MPTSRQAFAHKRLVALDRDLNLLQEQTDWHKAHNCRGKGCIKCRIYARQIRALRLERTILYDMSGER
jgi:hypothetical protein